MLGGCCACVCVRWRSVFVLCVRACPHVVLRGAAHVAALALDALPAVRLDGRHHHRRELQAGGVAWGGTNGHGQQT